jgi:hypothetical protein
LLHYQCRGGAHTCFGLEIVWSTGFGTSKSSARLRFWLLVGPSAFLSPLRYHKPVDFVVSAEPMHATASKKLAMIALVPFMYSIFQHEMRILIEGKKSTFKAEKRPRALKQEKPSEEAPGMGLSYMYNPGGKFYLSFGAQNLAVNLDGVLTTLLSLWDVGKQRAASSNPSNGHPSLATLRF